MKTSEKITYTIDPHNRLIAKKTGKASGVKAYRQVLDGRFKIGKGNTLTYHVKKSSNTDIPQQVRLSGTYSLEKDRDLVFTLNKWSNQVEGNKLIIKGQLLDAKDDELSFIVGTRNSRGNASIYILKLSGAWRADKYNRLRFDVTRQGNAADDLTLKGAWKVNDNNEITYTHSKVRLKTKVNIKNTLAFKGRWDITEKRGISYLLNKDIGSRFDFTVGFIRATRSGLEYKVSIGTAPVAKKMAISGKWKLSKRTSLSLELTLKDSRGKDLKTSMRLSRKILKGKGEAFAQALRRDKESTLLAGIGFRW